MGTADLRRPPRGADSLEDRVVKTIFHRDNEVAKMLAEQPDAYRPDRRPGQDRRFRLGVGIIPCALAVGSRRGSAEQVCISMSICPWLEIFRNGLTCRGHVRAAALMSTSDPNRSSSPPVLRSAERSETVLSSAICCHDGHDLLSAAIESPVKQHLPDHPFEIVVIGDASDQAGAARFGMRYAGLPNLARLAEPKPGPSIECNLGMAVGPAWIGEPLLGRLAVVGLGHDLRELSAGEWLAECSISFDRVSLTAASGLSGSGRIGSGSTRPRSDGGPLCARAGNRAALKRERNRVDDVVIAALCDEAEAVPSPSAPASRIPVPAI
jgi:hypothetical protein